MTERKEGQFSEMHQFCKSKSPGQRIGCPGLLDLQNWCISDLERFSPHPSSASPALCRLCNTRATSRPFHPVCFTRVKFRIVRPIPAIICQSPLSPWSPDPLVALELDLLISPVFYTSERAIGLSVWKRPLASLFYTRSPYYHRSFVLPHHLQL